MAIKDDFTRISESDPIIQINDSENLPRENIEANSNTHADDEATSQDNSNGSVPQEEMRRLQRDILYMYKTPYEKYKERRQFPYNMIVQILKIIFVTIQVSAEIFWIKDTVKKKQN